MGAGRSVVGSQRIAPDKSRVNQRIRTEPRLVWDAPPLIEKGPAQRAPRMLDAERDVVLAATMPRMITSPAFRVFQAAPLRVSKPSAIIRDAGRTFGQRHRFLCLGLLPRDARHRPPHTTRRVDSTREPQLQRCENGRTFPTLGLLSYGRKFYIIMDLRHIDASQGLLDDFAGQPACSDRH